MSRSLPPNLLQRKLVGLRSEHVLYNGSGLGFKGFEGLGFKGLEGCGFRS